jgi:hypothetical protein
MQNHYPISTFPCEDNKTLAPIQNFIPGNTNTHHGINDTGDSNMHHCHKAQLYERKEGIIKGMQRVTTDPNDLIESDKEEGHQGTYSKQGHKDKYHNPPSLQSTIKVMKASNSHVKSSVPGLSSIMDMSMTEISEENQVLLVKGCIKNHVSSIWKFYHFHSHFSKDDKTMCGFIMMHTPT